MTGLCEKVKKTVTVLVLESILLWDSTCVLLVLFLRKNGYLFSLYRNIFAQGEYVSSMERNKTICSGVYCIIIFCRRSMRNKNYLYGDIIYKVFWGLLICRDHSGKNERYVIIFL